MFVRGPEVQRIVSLLSAGTSVEMLGTRWSGRTEILRRVDHALQTRGFTTLTVRGVGGDLPLEAIRIALPPALRGTLPPRGLGVGVPVDALEGRVSSENMVIIVDDADLLDSPSWLVLETLHKATGVPLLTVSLRHGLNSIPPHTLIRMAHPVVQITLDSLSLSAVHDIVEERLGGLVSPEISSRIHTSSGGVPGYALAIADAALSANLIHLEDSGWVADPAPFWSRDLEGAFEALLASYSDEVQDALKILSIVGIVDLDIAVRLLGQERIEELEGYDLIRLIPTATSPMVAVNPPGIADYFRYRPVTARRLRLLDHIEHTLAGGTAPEQIEEIRALWSSNPIRPGRLPLRTNVELPSVILMFAEKYRERRLGTLRQWQRDPTMGSAAAVLSHRLTGSDGPEDDYGLIERGLGAARGTAREETQLRYLAAHTVLNRGGTLPEALALMHSDNPEAAEALDSLGLAIRCEMGSIPENFDGVLRPRIGRDGIAGEAASLALLAGLILAGRGEDALAVDSARRSSISAVLLPQLDYFRGLALIAAGRSREAVELAIDLIETAIPARDRTALAGQCYVAALGLLSLSRFEDAHDIASLPMRIGITSSHLLLSPDRALLTLMAALSSAAGRPSAAESLAGAAEAFPSRSDGLPFAGPAWSSAAVQMFSGRRDSARSNLDRLAEDLAAQRCTFAARIAAFFAVISEFSAEGARAYLRGESGPVDDLARAYLEARGATLTEDPAQVADAATRLAGLGAHPAAQKYFERAARLYRERGDLDASARTRRRATRLAEDAPGGAPTAAGPGSVLTGREQEVVRLIAQGLSNGQIATRLVISIRTVESHINRISKKTGAHGRGEIAAVTPR